MMNTYKWDLDDFIFFEKQVPPNFKYIDEFVGDDLQRARTMYDTIINWMQ